MSTIKEKTIELIDALKATCKTYGMGNDGNEYKIITQVFLYKFLNDKFGYEVKNAKSDIAKKIRDAEKWETAYAELALAIFSRLVMHHKLTNLLVTGIFCKVGDVAVHVAIYLDVLDILVAVCLKAAVEVVQVLDARHLACGSVE